MSRLRSKPPGFEWRTGSWLYFIQADDGPVKVGITIDPVNRLTIFQTGNHHELRLRHKIWIHPLSEREVHRLIEHIRVRGEWFDSSVLDAVIPLEAIFGIPEPLPRKSLVNHPVQVRDPERGWA